MGMVFLWTNKQTEMGSGLFSEFLSKDFFSQVLSCTRVSMSRPVLVITCFVQSVI